MQIITELVHLNLIKYLEERLKLGNVRNYTSTPETLREASFDFTNFYKKYKPCPGGRIIDSN